MRSTIIVLLTWLCILQAGNAQNLKDIFKSALEETAMEEKSRMDTVDFIFAISVSDNTGFVDVANKGEITANVLYAFRDEKQKSAAEVARDSLQEAIRFYKLRFYRLAEINFQWTRKQMEQNGLQGDINYLRCLAGKAVVSLSLGKTGQTDEELRQVEELIISRLGRRSPAYAANLNTRAKWNQAVGNYNEAESQFAECLSLSQQLFGPNSLQTAIVTNNQAMLSLAMGRNEDAVRLMAKANTIAAGIYDDALKGKKSFERRMFLSNQALVYQGIGNYPESEKVFLEIKKIYENRGQKSNPDYANVLNQLGMLYLRMGKPAQAEPLLKTVGDIYKRVFGEQSPAFGRILHDLSVFCRLTDRLPEAEQYGMRALKVRKAVLGESHPDHARTMEQLGLVYWRQGKPREAYGMLKGAADRSLQFINDYFKPMSEAEKSRYWATLQPGFQRFYAFAIDQEKNIQTLKEDVFRYQLVTKAILLQSTSKTRQAVLSGGDPALMRDYKEWIARKEMLARYYGLTRDELGRQQIDLPALEQEANALEKSLSQRSSRFSETFGREAPTLAAIAARLGEQESLVEMVRVNGFDKDFTEDTRYLALVLSKGTATPVMRVLKNGHELETRYAKYYRNTVTNHIEDAYSYGQYWAPIDSLLGARRVVYFSPDGVYNQININTLRNGAGEYVLTRREVMLLGNPGDLLRVKSAGTASSGKKAFLLGFPDYQGRAVPLPGTKTELENISRVLKASGFTVTIRQQQEASETSLRAASGATVVHIATHGYFIADNQVGTGDVLGVDAAHALANPLLRAGLILAAAPGASTGGGGFSSNDNGVLTAYEAMNLDLEGTNLLVLSACETGLGEVRAGEGVYGLQRAFLVAGARTIIMSLWKVDDQATQELMNGFYQTLTKETDRLKAFRLAQLKLMEKYKDPYYWGAFVLMGM